MIRCRTLDTIEVFSGRIGITADQANLRRPGTLTKVRTGLYKVENPVQFKRGEIIDLEAIPKGWYGRKVEVLEDEKKKDSEE